jgi:uncharacterized protein (DUF1800 family)
MEWVENRRWREALLDPECTFHDLLRISAESPAMIIFLDSVTSRGDGRRVANENYARELFELFCMGVDNGYDQTDIVEMSRVWTGWRLRLVDATNEFNPFAPQSTTLLPGATDTNVIADLQGVWAFNYRADYHNPSNKVLFAGRMIPGRFGSPYTERYYGGNSAPGLYEYTVQGRTGTNGLAEGYAALAYLADLPFTQEFISAKLCRWFVHDDFDHGVYDYTAPDLSSEGQLVKACMAAWDGGNPKGQIRDVMRVICNFTLFRGHGGSLHKVKTPLEYSVSAVRALRSRKPDGSYTAEIDAHNLPAALSRMGGMSLFNRADPDGYPEAAPGWISAGTLAERLRYVEALCIAPGQSGRSDVGSSFCDPAGLLQLKMPPSAWTNAHAVTDFFLGLLFPAEGRANLAELRLEAIHYLNRSDNGSADAPFALLAIGSTAYDTRLRGMAAMLLSTQRFQEQ